MRASNASVVFRILHVFLLTGYVLMPVSEGYAQKEKNKKAKRPAAIKLKAPIEVGEFIEADQPFYHSTVDARPTAAWGWPKDNLVPRGIIMHLNDRTYACFDPDLVRLAMVWQGEYIELNGMAPGSYNELTKYKSAIGQTRLPKVQVDPLVATGNYPGCYMGNPTFSDPRVASPDPKELSKGSLMQSGDKQQRRFLGLFPFSARDWRGVVLENPSMSWAVRYEINGTRIDEIYDSSPKFFTRHFLIQPHDKTMSISLIDEGQQAGRAKIELTKPDTKAQIKQRGNKFWLEVKPARKASLISVDYFKPRSKLRPAPLPKAKPRLTMDMPRVIKSDASLPVYLETIPLPWKNSRRRSMRVSGLDFKSNGNAVICTFDGDVWEVSSFNDLVSGSKVDSQVRWTRIARGLNEPQSVAIRENRIFVFHRGGIVELLPTKQGDYAQSNFCDLIVQTAETRQFAMDLLLLKDGSFAVATGGQQKLRGKHNGCVLHVAKDGRSVKILAHGLREPYIGYDARSDSVYASDQQGHYVPATPWRLIAGHVTNLPSDFKAGFHGYEDTRLKDKTAVSQDFVEPVAWIPHQLNPSSCGYLFPRKTGKNLFFGQFLPEYDVGLHVEYMRSKVFIDYLDAPGNNTGTVKGGATGLSGSVVGLPLQSALAFAPLKAAINPVDGHVYVLGFQIWGSVAKDLSGFGRLRFDSKSQHQLPMRIRFVKEGALITFRSPLKQLPKMLAKRWNYQLTKSYGSPPYMLNGEAGQETMSMLGSILSEDRKTFFVALDDMRLCDQLTLDFAWDDAENQWPKAYTISTSITQLRDGSSVEGFPGLDQLKPLDPSQVIVTKNEDRSPSKDWGKELAVQFGCIGCHVQQTQSESKQVVSQALVAPGWQGLYNSSRELVDGKKVKANAAYLKRAILEPHIEVVKGYQPAMPSYKGLLTDNQIESLVLYIKHLK